MHISGIWFKNILTEITRTAKRFPFALLFCATACVVSWSRVGKQYSNNFNILLLSLVASALLFYAIELLKERNPLAWVKPWYLILAGFVFAVMFYLKFSSLAYINYSLRYAHWIVIIGLFSLCAAYLAGNETNGFWQFNKKVFLRGILSWLYMAVLFGGISLAILAIEKLFEIKINHKVHEYIWIFATHLFWPLHFLSGIPENYAELNETDYYPRGLKLFAQYVFIPLACVYYAILYIYVAKIIITRQWPMGWVGWLTISASSLGLLTFLLLYPLARSAENVWIDKFLKMFSIAAVPLIFVLFVAAYKRVSQYGITEPRYFLFAAGLWFLSVFVYLILETKPDIRKILVSLAVMTILTTFGPWGAYSLSLSSQMTRLEKKLSAAGLLKDGKIIKIAPLADSEKLYEIGSSLDYIVREHGIKPLEKYFTEDISSLNTKYTQSHWKQDILKELMSYMGQNYIMTWQRNDIKTTYFHFIADKAPIDIRGYDTMINIDYITENLSDTAPYAVKFGKGKRTLLLFKGHEQIIEIPFPNLNDLELQKQRTKIAAEKLRSESENKMIKTEIYFTNIQANINSGVTEIISASGFLLIKEKTKK